MSKEFEKLMLEELKKVNKKLDTIDTITVNIEQDVTGLKQDVTVLKKDVTGLKQDVTVLKEDVTEIKQDTAVLKEDVSGLKDRMDRLEYKMDISNTNISSMLERQNELSEQIKIGHKELLEKFEKYEKRNELEHSKLNYEICKLKVHA